MSACVCVFLFLNPERWKKQPIILTGHHSSLMLFSKQSWMSNLGERFNYHCVGHPHDFWSVSDWNLLTSHRCRLHAPSPSPQLISRTCLFRAAVAQSDAAASMSVYASSRRIPSLEGFYLAAWFLLTLFYNRAHLWTKCVALCGGKYSASLEELIKCVWQADQRYALSSLFIFISS